MAKDSSDKKLGTRLLELIPGIWSWGMILSPVWGGLFFPLWYAYFVIFFNVYWLYKSVSTAIYFTLGYTRIKQDENVDWMSKLEGLDNIHGSIDRLQRALSDVENAEFGQSLELGALREGKSSEESSLFDRLPMPVRKILFALEKIKLKRYLHGELKRLEDLASRKDEILDWGEIKHVVMIIYYKEGYEVLKPVVEKLANQTFPQEQISLVLATEARAPEGAELAERLKKEFSHKFANVWITRHEIAGRDIVGKSSNMAYAGKWVYRKIKKLGWDLNKTTVTTLDSDNQFDPQYFSYLTYLYVTDPERLYKFFHSPVLYYANIWEVPFYGRILNTLFTIGNIANSVKRDRLIQVSAYSSSFRLIKDIGFWDPSLIPEDFHTFLKALYKHKDKVVVEPIYLKTLVDAAKAATQWKTVVNQYEQVKRWAWGITDDVWIMKMLWRKRRELTPYVLYRSLHIMYNHFTWPIISFLLLFGANIPPLVNRRFSQTVIGSTLPGVSSTILTICTGTFFFVVLLDLFLKPPRKRKVNPFRWLLEQATWVTFPIVSLLFAAIPGLDSHTRLLFGKYLEYRLTEKK